MRTLTLLKCGLAEPELWQSQCGREGVSSCTQQALGSREAAELRDTSVSWEWPPNTARRGDAAQGMADFPGDVVALTSKAAWAAIAVARLNQLEPCQDALGHFSVLQKVVWSSDTVFSHCCSVPASAGTIGSCWLKNLNKEGALILVASDPLSWVLK